jgi:hypothetical protein
MDRFSNFIDTIPGLGLVILVVVCLFVAAIMGLAWLVSAHPLFVGIPLLALFAYGFCCFIAGTVLND